MPSDRSRFRGTCSEVVWAAIEKLTPGEQYELLRELATVHALSARYPRDEADKVRAAVVALREVADMLGHSPSVKEYRSIRVRLPALRLPPDGTIRRWLVGSWSDCLRRALLDAVIDGDFAARPFGVNDRYDNEEIFAALRECAEECGHTPASTEYFRWAKRPDVRERPGRRPTSFKPFERFGGLRNALIASGVLAHNGARYALNGRVLPSRYRYSDEDILEALRAIAERLGRSPHPRHYERERLRLNNEAISTGEMHTLPTPEVIRTRFRTWNAALVKAGLAPLADGRPRLGESCPRYTEAEKIEWLNTAWVEVGEPFTPDAYKRWRRSKISAAGVWIPTLATIERTFGGWTNACRIALPGRGANECRWPVTARGAAPASRSALGAQL